jgi:hypothetical protein
VGDEGIYHAPGIIVRTHVDDLLAIGEEAELEKLKTNLESEIELDDKGRPERMLGLDITWKEKGNELVLTQKEWIDTLAKQHQVQGTKTTVPIAPHYFSSPTEMDSPCNQKEYQSIVGSLLFITRMTRPDVAIQVNLLGRHCSNPSTSNLEGAREVIRYLRTTEDHGIIIRKPENSEAKIYADASYGDSITRSGRSQSGSLITYGNQPLDWWTRRQDVVALSITEAEYIAACEGAKDAAALRQLLSELKVSSPVPLLLTDSEGAEKLSKSGKFQRRSRHIEHRFHYLRSEVNHSNLKIRHLPGKENPADMLTKVLPPTTIQQWKSQWMGTSGKSNGTNG